MAVLGLTLCGALEASLPSASVVGVVIAQAGAWQIATNVLVGSVHLAIAAAFLCVLRRGRRMPFHGAFTVLGFFLACCGLERFAAVWNAFQPADPATAITGACTAIVAVASAVALGLTIPKMIRVPGVEDLNARLDEEVRSRRRAEEALCDSQARLCSIVQHTGEGIVVIDDRGVVESFNPSAERLFGYPAAEIIGQNLTVLMPPQHRQRFAGRLAQSLTTTTMKIDGMRREVVGLRKDCTTIRLDVTVSEMSATGRRLYTGIVRDITDQKQAERKLQECVAVLQAANPTVEIAAAAGLAHRTADPVVAPSHRA